MSIENWVGLYIFQMFSKTFLFFQKFSSRTPQDSPKTMNFKKSLFLLFINKPLVKKMIFIVSACGVPMVIYTYKISSLKTLLLNNREIHNVWVLLWSYSFFTCGCLYCRLNISTRERFENLKFQKFSHITYGYIQAKFHWNPWYQFSSLGRPYRAMTPKRYILVGTKTIQGLFPCTNCNFRRAIQSYHL
jgi:hypothetical protein